MSNFDKAFEVVVGLEGGYSNDPVDAGGETKFGISKRAFPSEDIKNLTIDRAKELYKRFYWDRCGADQIKSYNIALQLFDIAINCGVGMAGKLIQRAINETSKVKTREDGIIGSKTIANINVSDVKILNNNLVAKRIEYYYAIVASKPTQKKFIRGWLNRAEKFTMR